MARRHPGSRRARRAPVLQWAGAPVHSRAALVGPPACAAALQWLPPTWAWAMGCMRACHRAIRDHDHFRVVVDSEAIRAGASIHSTPAPRHAQGVSTTQGRAVAYTAAALCLTAPRGVQRGHSLDEVVPPRGRVRAQHSQAVCAIRPRSGQRPPRGIHGAGA